MFQVQRDQRISHVFNSSVLSSLRAITSVRFSEHFQVIPILVGSIASKKMVNTFIICGRRVFFDNRVYDKLKLIQISSYHPALHTTRSLMSLAMMTLTLPSGLHA